MKSMAYLIAMTMLIALAGCIWPEEIETRVHYIDTNTPPQITVIWRNISSTAKDEEELENDFDSLVGDLEDSTASDLVAGIEKDLLIKDRQFYLQNGKLQARISAVPLDDKFEDLASNGERMVVIDLKSGGIVETNGRLLKTARNHIIVWSEGLNEIYWIQRVIFEAPDEDPSMWKRWEQNRPKLIKMFEAYQQKGN